ncbi:hypothetical protein PR003_g5303 [Phytophthora rubi]|uniref:Uncharacterized protein n=1 Tax=Phytophthora rubi TaxID=129364 RepID=A0A6A4G3D9_9STRA|nr:hypothetical protein PR003_g5303 [Phytophthora rubi]
MASYRGAWTLAAVAIARRSGYSAQRHYCQVKTGGCLHAQRPLPHAALPRARGTACVVRGGVCHASSTNTTRARSAE